MRCYTQHDIERYEKLSDNKFKNVHTNEMFAYLDGVDKGIEELEKIKAEAEELIEHCDSDYDFEEIYGIKLVVGIIDNHIKE